MQFEIVYGRTRDRLEGEVNRKIAEGWKIQGEVIIVQPEVISDLEVPKFLCFLQTVTKDN